MPPTRSFAEMQAQAEAEVNAEFGDRIREAEARAAEAAAEAEGDVDFDFVAIMEKFHAQNIAIIQTAHDRHLAEHDRHLAELNTLKAQHFTHIQALELKIFTLEQDLVRSKAMEFELEKEEGGGAGGGAGVQNMYETCNM